MVQVPNAENTKEDEQSKEKKPLLSKSAVLRILAELSRSYAGCAVLVCQHMYHAGQSELVTEVFLPDVLIIIVSGIAVLGYIQYLIAKHGIGIIMRWLILLCVHIIWTVCLKIAISSGAIVPINYCATWLPLPLRLTCDRPTVLRDRYYYVCTLLPVSPLNPYQVLMLLCWDFYS